MKLNNKQNKSYEYRGKHYPSLVTLASALNLQTGALRQRLRRLRVELGKDIKQFQFENETITITTF